MNFIVFDLLEIQDFYCNKKLKIGCILVRYDFC